MRTGSNLTLKGAMSEMNCAFCSPSSWPIRCRVELAKSAQSELDRSSLSCTKAKLLTEPQPNLNYSSVNKNNKDHKQSISTS